MNRRQFFKTTAVSASACLIPLSELKSDVIASSISLHKVESKVGIYNGIKPIPVERYPTGYYLLDKALGGGIKPNTLTIICGPALSGKYKFLKDICNSISVELGFKDRVGYFRPDLNSITITNNEKDVCIGYCDYNFGNKDADISDELNSGKTVITAMQTPKSLFSDKLSGIKLNHIYKASLVIHFDKGNITIIRNRYGKTGAV